MEEPLVGNQEEEVRGIPSTSGGANAILIEDPIGPRCEEGCPSESRAEGASTTEDRSSTESVRPAASLPIDDGAEDRVLTTPGEVLAEDQSDAAASPDSQGSRKPNGSSNCLADGESRESKERFRERLWCFLFENLNRSVDELYLLCELECDMEHIEEAILVLQESISDFEELKSRVEGFNSSKRPVSHATKDGMLVNVKMETRRPHALSWEVRRMTTSTHKAEILSSSLEAFKRIQLERATNHFSPVSEAVVSQISQNIAIGHVENLCDAVKTRTDPGPSVRSNKRNDNGGRENLSMENMMLNAETSHQPVPLLDNNVPAINTVILLDGSTVRKDASYEQNSLEHSSENDCQGSNSKVFLESKPEKSFKGENAISSNLEMAEVREKERGREKNVPTPWKSMDAWKEKRNWEAILKSPSRSSSKGSHSPILSRKNVERAKTLHDKLMSPEKKKKTTSDVKKKTEEKHARATRIRNQLETEKMQRLQRTSEKLKNVNTWQAVRSLKLREGMCARQQRSESRHEAYLAQVVKRAYDESSKVNEVRFITSLNEENKKLMLRQKLHDSEIRRAEKLQVMRTRQREDMAKEEAALERRKLLEAEKLQRLAETQRKKEEAQMRREEERRASSAAREARALEQLRRKEERAKAQQEEAELLALKLAEKLRESEQRRKFYLEQIREKASMDFRDLSSPLLRRSINKDGQSRVAGSEDCHTCDSGAEGSLLCSRNVSQNQSLKRRIKKIRQKLMALKYDFVEPSITPENAGPGYRSFMGTTKVKIGRWLHDLQKLRQARKEGSASIGLIVGEITKFLEGKETELHVSRQAGLVDFIASALPASHNSRPGACQVTTYFLRLLKVILTLPANRNYFLSQNLLPPIIPMLSSSLENYIKIAASLNHPGNNVLLSTKVSSENLESVAEILEGFLWTVTTIVGDAPLDEKHLLMSDGLIELVVSYQIIHHLRDLFALYDRPHVEGSPFPSVIIYGLNLLGVLTSRTISLSSNEVECCLSWPASMTYNANLTSTRSSVSLALCASCSVNFPPRADDLQSCTNEEKISGGMSLSNMHEERKLISANEKAQESHYLDVNAERAIIFEPANGKQKEMVMKQPVTLLIAAIAETGLVSLPSLLTAVLLQANNKVSSELNCHVLPSNFEEVSIGVLRVLNNLAMLNTTFLQNMLAMTDLKMEFFHLMSFLLSHCTNKWKMATDQVGVLLVECLSLLGYFCFLHSENQAVLRWGKGPTILHKICDLPFGFFSDPELMPILAGTLVAACYGCEQNRGIMQQELSIDMLLSLLKSCRQDVIPVVQQGSLSPENPIASDNILNSKVSMEAKRSQGDLAKSSRRNGKIPSGKNISCISTRANKSRNHKDSKVTKKCHIWDLKHKLPVSGTCFPLYARFSSTFLDKAEVFFSGGTGSIETSA